MFKKGLLTGLLLFGIFFGAGNLIFPPTVGFLSGENFWLAISGFIISGVGFPIIGLIVGSFNKDGYKAELDRKFHPLFSILLLSALYLSIGPFFAIPRTAALSFDISIAPLTGDFAFASIIFTTLYFGFGFYLAYNSNKLLDHVGKILTPIFSILIITIVVLGVFKYANNPIVQIDAGYSGNLAFGKGFVEGFNTLDTLAAVAFCIIGMSTLKQLGFSDKKEYLKAVWVAAFVVMIAFSALYTGLALLGNKLATTDLTAGANIGVYTLKTASVGVFGIYGGYFLAIMTVLTCFTTAVGLIAATAKYFNQIYSKISYKQYVIIFTLISYVISNFGLGNIIKFSIPVLLLLYPMVITLIIIVIINKFIKLSKLGMNLTMAIVTLISLIGVLGNFLNIQMFSNFINSLPLANESMPWLIPMIFTLLLSLMLKDKQEAETFDFNYFKNN